MSETEIDLNLKQPIKEVKKTTVLQNDEIQDESDIWFKDKPKVEKAIGISNADLVDSLLKKSNDDILPWETATLPSLGLFYNDRIPGGIVEVKQMGLVADKILATQRLNQTGQSLDFIFQKYVRFPDRSFDPLDLLPGDRTFLLYYLRGITYGNMYEFQLNCTNSACNAFNQYDYDLNNLSRTIKHPKINSEPIRVILPHFSQITGTDFWVDIRLLRQRDIKNIGSKKKIVDKIGGGEISDAKGRPVKKRPIQDDLDQSIEENINMAIVSVMGVVDRFKIQGIVQRMHATDTSVIRETLNDAAPGLDTQVKIKCPECQNEMVIDLPLTESFFRAKDANRVRE